jgi:hypothetical protein
LFLSTVTAKAMAFAPLAEKQSSLTIFRLPLVKRGVSFRGNAVDSVLALVKRIQANSAVPNSLKANLGITVRDANPSPDLPVRPSNSP